MNFEIRTLKELVCERVIEIKTGPFGTQLKASDYVPEGIPVVNVRNIGFGNIVDEKLERISKATAQRLSAHLLATNDIVFGRKGAVERHAFIGESCNGWLQGSDCIRLRVLNRKKVLPRYLSYFFLTAEHKNRMMSLCSHGSTMASLNQSILEVMGIPHTSIENQETIVSMLTPLDDKIELNNRIIANLEAQAQAIFKSCFLDFEPFQDGEFEESELGLIPKGWRVVPFTEAVHVLGGGTPKTDVAENWNGDIPFFTPKDAGSATYTLQTEKTLTEKGLNACNSRLYSENTVFVTARGTVGKIALAGKPMAMNQSCYALVGKHNINQYFVFHLAQNTVERLKGKASGAVFDAIVTRDFDSELIVSPKEGTIMEFAGIVKPLYQQMLCLEKQNVILRTTRDSLLPKLMSGEIEVPVEG